VLCFTKAESGERKAGQMRGWGGVATELLASTDTDYAHQHPLGHIYPIYCAGFSE